MLYLQPNYIGPTLILRWTHGNEKFKTPYPRYLYSDMIYTSYTFKLLERENETALSKPKSHSTKKAL